MKENSQCSVIADKTGKNCPENPTKQLNGDPICDKCYKTWRLILTSDKRTEKILSIDNG